MKKLLFALLTVLVSGSAAAALNLNTATMDELIALQGIGPAKAQAIVDYRNQFGPFKSVDEVRKVKGIGEKLFNQIRPELSVGPAARPATSLQGKPEANGAAVRPAAAAVREDKARR